MSVCGFVHVIAVPVDTKNEWSPCVRVTGNCELPDIVARD